MSAAGCRGYKFDLGVSENARDVRAPVKMWGNNEKLCEEYVCGPFEDYVRSKGESPMQQWLLLPSFRVHAEGFQIVIPFGGYGVR